MDFANNDTGFDSFTQWLASQGITQGNSIICLECTGVYNEALIYWLAARQWRTAVEAPHHVKRGMGKPQKNDAVDAQHIAEYAFRYYDKLHRWQAPDSALERISTLLTTREHCQKHRTAVQNMLTALKRKMIRTSAAEGILEQQLNSLKEQVRQLDAEIKREIDSNDNFRRMTELATSVPGVGMMLSAQLLVLSQGLRRKLYHKELASYLGMCPHEHQSGSSVYRNPRSRQSCPSTIRRLLFLAAMTLRRYDQHFQRYFQDKKAQHKPGRLILNNIANKLLKILCAVINSSKKFDAGHISQRPTPKICLTSP